MPRGTSARRQKLIGPHVEHQSEQMIVCSTLGSTSLGTSRGTSQFFLKLPRVDRAMPAPPQSGPLSALALLTGGPRDSNPNEAPHPRASIFAPPIDPYRGSSVADPPLMPYVVNPYQALNENRQEDQQHGQQEEEP